jgi:hypothetical protein
MWTALGLVRFHVFILIRLGTREVHIAGIIPEAEHGELLFMRLWAGPESEKQRGITRPQVTAN